MTSLDRPNRRTGLLLGLLAAASVLLMRSEAAGGGEPNSLAPGPAALDSSFPDVNQVLQGRVFSSTFERDVFFLREIRRAYPDQWVPLLSANLTLKDYVEAPQKLLRFVRELGAALAQTDDQPACNALAALVADPAFFANPDAYRPEILAAAATSLTRIGPRGRRTLAHCFTQDHYRADPASLEVLTEAIGQSGVPDSEALITALASTAFTFTATNGGFYEKCTRLATRNLLRLPQGADAVNARLCPAAMFKDPGRFEAVVDAVADAGAKTLLGKLHELDRDSMQKLATLAAHPGDYRDELSRLEGHLRTAISRLQPASGAEGR